MADKSTGLYSGSIEVPFGGHGKLYGIVAVPNSCPTGTSSTVNRNLNLRFRFKILLS